MDILFQKTALFISKLFEEKLPETCIYHNYAHTMRVVKSTKEIIEHSTISEEDNDVLLLTALLHDAGYTQGCEDHEERSIIIATNFLKDQNVPDTIIEKISVLIRATKMDHVPTTELEKVIRDADSSHFAKKYYPETSELLRKELQLQNIADFSPSQWLKVNINMFQNIHRYQTDYAIKNWKPIKKENLKRLIAERKQIKKEKKKSVLKERFKQESPEKSVQTLFRVTLRNHLKLSDIADTKANILLSVNAIIISMVLSNLIPKLDNPSNTYLIIPTAIFVCFSSISMVLSILATRPKVTTGEFTEKEVEEKKVNLLFFGNFHQMPLDAYRKAMHGLIEDKQYIYDTLIKDLYFLGIVLNKKYKILRITYSVFMIGIIVSVLSFIIAFKYSQL